MAPLYDKEIVGLFILFFLFLRMHSINQYIVKRIQLFVSLKIIYSFRKLLLVELKTSDVLVSIENMPNITSFQVWIIFMKRK